ncbi:MAG: hypothetical protein EBQ99_03275, partial [Planctomycetes bacterium]|nr:hypothetical protein [Planctomycetota bacterium]
MRVRADDQRCISPRAAVQERFRLHARDRRGPAPGIGSPGGPKQSGHGLLEHVRPRSCGPLQTATHL